MARNTELQRYRDETFDAFSNSLNVTAAEVNKLDGFSPLSISNGTALVTKADDYTFVLGDANKAFDFGAASGKTATIPANASVAFPVGTILVVTKSGANTLTLAITTDTLISLATPVLAASGGAALLIKVAATTWVCVSGNIS